jgi:hypothetical protein
LAGAGVVRASLLGSSAVMESGGGGQLGLEPCAHDESEARGLGARARPVGGQVARGMRDASARALGHAARGPAPRDLWPGSGARATEGGGGTSVEAWVHGDNFTASVHRSKVGKPCGRRGPDACATRWARR